MTATQTPAASGRRRLLHILLAGSVLLNVVGGTYIATDYVLRDRTPPFSMSQGRLLSIVADRLPPRVGQTLRADFEKRRPEMQGALADYRRALNEAARLLLAQSLDEQAFRAKIEEARKARARGTDLVLESITRTLAAMPPEKRRELALRALERRVIDRRAE